MRARQPLGHVRAPSIWMAAVVTGSLVTFPYYVEFLF